MQVAELVPEIALMQGFAVGDAQVLAACEGFEHREVGGARLVQAGEHRVYRPDTALGRDDQARPASAGVRGSVPVHDGLERSHGRRPDSDDTPTRNTGGVHQAGGIGRDAVELLVGRLVVLEAGHAGVQYQGRELDASGDETGDELGRERPPGGRHLRATPLRGVDRLVVAYGPAPLYVAVADREPVPVEILLERPRQINGRE